MNLTLLTDTAHSNAVTNHDDDRFLFAAGQNIVLCNNPELTTVFGCPAKRIGFKKRPFNEAEKAHQQEYNNGKPEAWDNGIWAVYQVDWTQFDGDPIPGTNLREGGCISSGGLSDATISRFAVDRELNQVVSYTKTSYWVSDKHDIPNWHKALFQKYPAHQASEVVG